MHRLQQEPCLRVWIKPPGCMSPLLCCVGMGLLQPRGERVLIPVLNLPIGWRGAGGWVLARPRTLQLAHLEAQVAGGKIMDHELGLEELLRMQLRHGRGPKLRHLEQGFFHVFHEILRLGVLLHELLLDTRLALCTSLGTDFLSSHARFLLLSCNPLLFRSDQLGLLDLSASLLSLNLELPFCRRCFDSLVDPIHGHDLAHSSLHLLHRRACPQVIRLQQALLPLWPIPLQVPDPGELHGSIGAIGMAPLLLQVVPSAAHISRKRLLRVLGFCFRQLVRLVRAISLHLCRPKSREVEVANFSGEAL
mmetsp:Transcript_18371/g.34437  ORF Transcript_18371/g.34437 Transcript_18371/m.34437 type:complete len:306 (-) Transcript_18371:53-970(-)